LNWTLKQRPFISLLVTHNSLIASLISTLLPFASEFLHIILLRLQLKLFLLFFFKNRVLIMILNVLNTNGELVVMIKNNNSSSIRCCSDSYLWNSIYLFFFYFLNIFLLFFFFFLCKDFHNKTIIPLMPIVIWNW
jgi:hypothetical protein